MCPADSSALVARGYVTFSVNLRASGSWEVGTHMWVDNAHDNIGETHLYEHLEQDSCDDIADGTMRELTGQILDVIVRQVVDELDGQEVFPGF